MQIGSPTARSGSPTARNESPIAHSVFPVAGFNVCSNGPLMYIYLSHCYEVSTYHLS